MPRPSTGRSPFLLWSRHLGASLRRAVQAHGRNRNAARAVSRRRACAQRPVARAGRRDVQQYRRRTAAHSGRQRSSHVNGLGRNVPQMANNALAGLGAIQVGGGYGKRTGGFPWPPVVCNIERPDRRRDPPAGTCHSTPDQRRPRQPEAYSSLSLSLLFTGALRCARPHSGCIAEKRGTRAVFTRSPRRRGRAPRAGFRARVRWQFSD
jgi:hypothetical protein